MKKVAKQLITAVLGWQVRRMRKKNDLRVVAVAGSVGKTSTKFAIARVLGQRFKVRFQQGNYNDITSVPLIFFGLPLPVLLNPFGWLKIFLLIEKQLRQPYPYEIVVIELGTDGPGQLEKFRKYLQADIGVLTAIAPEHMEFFKNLDAVAQEELQISQLSNSLFVNKDLCAGAYLEQIGKPYISYGIKKGADYRAEKLKFGGDGYDFNITRYGEPFMKLKHGAISETQLYSVTAAVAVASELGMEPAAITRGINTIKPVGGRMQRLRGIRESTIIDDTYNASPIATKAALDTLYRLKAPQKIAILGNMNELGSYSEAAHREIGEYCDPRRLDLVVTIGPDANRFLGPAAQAKGCQVRSFDNSVEAGKYLKNILQEKALILAKGSQNGVFAEEAVKQLLADRRDQKKLVRQSKQWLKIKASLL